MSKNNDDSNKKNYYFPLCTGIGLILGVILKQIPIGLCLGAGVGLALDGNKKKK
ncbi:MAG TPA: hypothetical protein K8V90_09725 [Romboutsia timonensis]|uniref:Uncharacterized protein n=1 Tax=Romboutsia timonensis TaxID=1776391 RepID=A0A921N1Q5_9FIRM|nr:hypothetical protein [uncultured Romboutsia sp.]HJF35814.1 hypothetical protein [Clostridium perfringens]HJG97368.1 hypothetical protein [Romboutsia timonensis]